MLSQKTEILSWFYSRGKSSFTTANLVTCKYNQIYVFISGLSICESIINKNKVSPLLTKYTR